MFCPLGLKNRTTDSLNCHQLSRGTSIGLQLISTLSGSCFSSCFFCYMLQRIEKESETYKRNPATTQGCNKDLRRRHSYCPSRYTCGEATTQEDVGTEENPPE